MLGECIFLHDSANKEPLYEKHPHIAPVMIQSLKARSDNLVTAALFHVNFLVLALYKCCKDIS